MQTRFTAEQLADPAIQTADDILRSCVHCGFCNAACPTYQLTGDELDGPRGRIYLIKEMLEQDRAPGPVETRHLDRCLSCLSCMSACPSGVDYMHLIDPARYRIEESGDRSLVDRTIRSTLVRILSDAGLAARMIALGRLVTPIMDVFPGLPQRLGRLLPRKSDSTPPAVPGVYPPEGTRKARVILLAGCVQQALAPRINRATIDLLTRLGCEVTVVDGAGCCGSLPHHMGDDKAAQDYGAVNIERWSDYISDHGPVDAIITNAAGCGTTMKDYGHIFATHPTLSSSAADIADRVQDVSEFMAELGLPEPVSPPDMTVAWQAPCALQHGQKITDQPIALLKSAGFTVKVPADPHLCCGSAGTYNILQGDMATDLRDRKQAALGATGAVVTVSANIGCMTQLDGDEAMPVLHIVELLNWATGGEKPAALRTGVP